MLTILLSPELKSISKLIWPFTEFQAIGPEPSQISRIAEGSHYRLLIKKHLGRSDRFSTRHSIPYISISTAPVDSYLRRQLLFTTSRSLPHSRTQSTSFICSI